MKQVTVNFSPGTRFRKWIWFLVFLAGLLSFPVLARAEDSVWITAGSLNVRKGPSTDSLAVGSLHYGDIQEVKGEKDGWYRISYQGKNAYIYGKYCIEADPVLLQERTADNLCEMDGIVDPDYIRRVNEWLSLIPKKLRVRFLDMGWHIYCTDKDIDSYFYNGMYGAVRGSTDWSTKTIHIEDRDSAVDFAVLHEFGHYLDFTAGFPSYSDSFSSVYNSESGAFCNTFTIDFHYDQNEFFAEAFDKFLTSPEDLQSACPQIYAIFENLVASI